MAEEKDFSRLRKSGAVALLIVLACCVLLYFLPAREKETADTSTPLELRLESVVGNIEGAGRVRAMIREDADGIAGVLVVCEGAGDLTVRLRVQTAVCTLLGVENSRISVVEMENAQHELE